MNKRGLWVLAAALGSVLFAAILLLSHIWLTRQNYNCFGDPYLIEQPSGMQVVRSCESVGALASNDLLSWFLSGILGVAIVTLVFAIAVFICPGNERKVKVVAESKVLPVTTFVEPVWQTPDRSGLSPGTVMDRFGLIGEAKEHSDRTQ